jgi:hypothetical protein
MNRSYFQVTTLSCLIKSPHPECIMRDDINISPVIKFNGDAESNRNSGECDSTGDSREFRILINWLD